MENTTIAAIATAAGEAGISIIRLSGPDALSIADSMFICSNGPPSKLGRRALVYGKIMADNTVIDEAILLIMRAPHSYTREDVVEFQTHGGATSARRVLRQAIEKGATHALPGEFTKRAFLNGRIDLLQAEAIQDLVSAKSERAARSAVEQLQGGLSTILNTVYERILTLAADVEVWLDFQEDDTEIELNPLVIKELEKLENELFDLSNTWEEGHILREGALVVISGLPNAGKSTLLNRLLKRERAIVSALPGTTRDTLEETFVLDGIPIRLVDTAGLREPESEIEADGVNRAWQQIEASSLIIYLADISNKLNTKDLKNLSRLDSRKTIVALNKSDLPAMSDTKDYGPFSPIAISCLSGAGIDQLKECLLKKIGFSCHVPAQTTISERHKDIISTSLTEIQEALFLLRSGEERMIPIISMRLRYAADCLGRILGRTFDSDLLNSIFSRFCVGK